MKTILRPSGEQNFLKDAIRDLVVVVVGILAALYLESWWQDRQDRAEEASLLMGLREEFVANREQLEGNLSSWSESAVAFEQARQLMEDRGTEMDVKQAIQLFFGGDVGGSPFFDPRTGQLVSLINSGKLGLIDNADLRAKIADWPDLVQDLDVERELSMYSFTVGYFPRLSQHVALVEGPPEPHFAELLADKKLYVELGLVQSNAQRAFDEGTIIMQATDDIIALIDARLADK